jgi:hypothetical protein
MSYFSLDRSRLHSRLCFCRPFTYCRSRSRAAVRRRPPSASSAAAPTHPPRRAPPACRLAPPLSAPPPAAFPRRPPSLSRSSRRRLLRRHPRIPALVAPPSSHYRQWTPPSTAHTHRHRRSNARTPLCRPCILCRLHVTASPHPCYF